MALLGRFDPPAFMPDYNAIPGQLDAWHRAMSSWFDAVVAIEAAATSATRRYYNESTFDPGGIRVEQAVTWNAFPKELLRRHGRDRAMQLADLLWPIESFGGGSADPSNTAGSTGVLYRPQEEYCEWHVVRDPDTNRILRVTFTSEPPEYWQALSGFVPGGGGIPDATFPGDRDVLLHLYRDLVSADVQVDDLFAPVDITNSAGDILVPKDGYNIRNKWNTTHGIAHLNSPPNSLVAEVQLGGDATVLFTDARGHLLVEPDALICAAGYGGPNRNSDPTIGSAVNALARLGAYVTLRNPVGLYMDHIDLSGWEAPDNGDVSEFVRIVRGTPGMVERMVIEAPGGSGLTVGDLTIAGVPIRFGGQIAECITVKLVGVANIVANPTPSPPVVAQLRSSLDPFYPSALGRSQSASSPLPAGTVQAFTNEGHLPGTTTNARASKSSGSASATSVSHHRHMSRAR